MGVKCERPGCVVTAACIINRHRIDISWVDGDFKGISVIIGGGWRIKRNRLRQGAAKGDNAGQGRTDGSPLRLVSGKIFISNDNGNLFAL